MRYLRNQTLKKHTSFRIGGPADYFCIPKNIEELKEALQFAKERKLRVAILGAGTNTLVLDRGFSGLVIKIAGGLNWIKVYGSKVCVGGGVLLPRLIRNLANKGLGGLEFLAGIPGSIGGAVVMNAGAWGKEIGKYVLAAKVLEKNGKEKIIKKKQLGFGYRKSRLQGKPGIITEVIFRLRKKKRKSIEKMIKEYLSRRKKNQPLGIPNSGSVFKNPRGSFAGKLIEEAGCKGMRIGDAQVSARHGNFIVNLGDARAKDVIKLMTAVQKAVKTKLEPEIKILLENSLYSC